MHTDDPLPVIVGSVGLHEQLWRKKIKRYRRRCRVRITLCLGKRTGNVRTTERETLKGIGLPQVKPEGSRDSAQGEIEISNDVRV